MQKITYASLGALGDDFHQAFDAALDETRQKSGRTYPLSIAGKPRRASGRTFSDVCPSDTRLVLGHFQTGSRADAQKAIAAAQSAFPSWRDTPWPERIRLLRKAAELMTQRQFEFAAIL